MVTGAYVNVDWVQFTDALADPGPIRIAGSDMRLSCPASTQVSVFGMTGKFLGRVEIAGTHSVHEISLGLKSAGFAQGVYMVRGASGVKRVQVR